MPFYMKIDGLPGDVSLKHYEGWIEVHAIHLSVEKLASTEPGKTTNRSLTRPKIQEAIIVKSADCATPILFQKSCEGALINEVRIHACHAGTIITPYLEYIFSNVIINRYDHGGQYDSDSSAILHEELRLNFSKIELRYIGQDNSNNSKAPITAGYDLKLAKTF